MKLVSCQGISSIAVTQHASFGVIKISRKKDIEEKLLKGRRSTIKMFSFIVQNKRKIRYLLIEGGEEGS